MSNISQMIGKTLRRRTVEATAYTWTGSKMANGRYPQVGYVAMNSIPFGTKVYAVELDRVFEVGDRIGWGSEMDIYMDTEAECQQFGRQNLSIIILN